MRYRATSVGACLLCSLLCLGCTVSSQSEIPAEDSGNGTGDWDGFALSQLSWVFTWETQDITQHEEGWSVTNGDGIEFTVESGWVSSYSASLAPCEAEESLWAERGLMERVLGIGIARADHGAVSDPSTLESPLLEDLSLLEGSRSSTLYFEPTEYCQLHYLVARADSDAEAPAPASPMALRTLRLDGSWTAGEDSGLLSIESAFNYGALFSLESATASSAGPAVEIEVRRQPSRLFDAVNPQLQSEEQLAWTVTQNLVQASEILIVEAEFALSE